MRQPRHQLVARVRTGRKRQTIRPWSRLLVRPGQICYAPEAHRLMIAALDELPSIDSTFDADLPEDRLASRHSLFAALEHIYLPSARGAALFYPRGAKRRRRLHVAASAPGIPVKIARAPTSNKTRKKPQPPRSPRPTRRALEQLPHPMHVQRPRRNPSHTVPQDRATRRDLSFAR